MSEQLTINRPDQVALNKTAEAFLTTARTMTIDCDDMYQTAASELQSIKAKAIAHEEQRTKLVAPLNQVVKDINAMFKPPADFLSQAEQIIKRAMLGYQEAVNQKRREAEARARADAEAAAARERNRIAQAEAAAAERNKLEQEELERQRQAALDAGDTVKAAQITAKAEGKAEVAEIKQESRAEFTELVQVAPVVQMPSAPKASGISTKSTWKAEVSDKLALVKYIAANPQWIHLIEPSSKEIGATAKALKGNATVIDGLRVWEEKTMASRAA